MQANASGIMSILLLVCGTVAFKQRTKVLQFVKLPNANRVASMGAALVLLGCVTFTSPLTGKWWNLEPGGKTGVQTVELNLTVDDDGKLAGTVTEFTAKPRDILTGKSIGKKFTFETKGLVNGRAVTVIWSGEIVTEDEISVSRQFQFDDGRILEAPNNPQRLYRDKQ